MTTLLPPSEPADPVQGQPGHFAWSNWIKQAVKNLDAGTLHIHEASGRNRIINGDFSVNQRGFTTYSGVGGGPPSIGLDRWGGYLSQASCSYSVQPATYGELPESAKQYARLVSAGQVGVGDYTSLVQQIEGVRTLSGKVVTVSFWARAVSGNPSVAVNIDQFFGIGGGASALSGIAFGKVVLSNSWVRYSLTTSLTSLAGKIVGTSGTDSLYVKLWTSAGSNYTMTSSLGLQNATIDFWGVQVEEGSIATAYEQKSYAQELAACQRYFYRMVPGGAAAGGASFTSAAVFAVPMPVSLRHGAPAVSFAVPIAIHDPGLGQGNAASMTVGWGNVNSQLLNINTTGYTFTTGRAAMLQVGVGGWIDFNAEL